MKKSKKIKDGIEIGINNIEFEAEAKPFGNQAHIYLPKAFAGKKVLIKVLDIKRLKSAESETGAKVK